MPPTQAALQKAAKMIESLLGQHPVVAFLDSTSGTSARICALLKSFDEPFEPIFLDKHEDGEAIRAALASQHNVESDTVLFAQGKLLGGAKEVDELHKSNQLYAAVRTNKYEYDLVVIGGGSGGLACAKQSASLGARVCAIDFVHPTPTGTKWGLGGTCVNVGCIPKKLMHQASLLREAMSDAVSFGWQTQEAVKAAKHSWSTLVENVNGRIKSQNWKDRVDIRKKGIEYINAAGSFVDTHTVETRAADGKTRCVTAKYVLVATGVRPTYLEIPNVREYTITSDDLFQLKREPGRTLVVGASYVALECAGFLAGIGYDVTVMVRSILLRGFDQQMANLIGDYMEAGSNSHPVRFVRECVPTKIEQVRPWNRETGELPLYRVTGQFQDGSVVDGEYNTILLAIGRSARTEQLNIATTGVALAKDGKLIVDDADCTNVPHIFAVGDVASGRPELTPSAIEAGQLLAKRLFEGGKILTDYINIPTTVFTPLEYGACGYSEEKAIEKFGAENIEVYHSKYTPTEWTVPERGENACYMKLVCLLPDEKIIGLHVASPNAGEIMQGYALALKMGATKAQLDATIGIHPTCSENFTMLNITKRSGKDPAKASCCS